MEPPQETTPADPLGDADAARSASTAEAADAPEAHTADAAAGTPSMLSLPSRTAIALGAAAVAVAVAFHLTMVFLHVAPANTVSRQHAGLVNAYVFPEFEQNWKLFAPNPLQQNLHVEARAQVRTPGGEFRTTGWVDLTGQDVEAIRHNVAPSHTEQNLLRRAWDFYASTHDDDNKAQGDRGALSERYVLRIVEERLGSHVDGGEVVRVQARAATVAVAAPAWSAEKTDTKTYYRQLPWWTVDRGRENVA